MSKPTNADFDRISTEAQAPSDESLARAFQQVRKEWEMYTFADGTLTLDAQKLRWRRRWFSLPLLGPRSFEIDLKDIEECRAGDSAIGIAMGHASGLVITTAERVYRLTLMKNLMYSKHKSAEWCEMIRRAVDDLEGQETAMAQTTGHEEIQGPPDAGRSP